MRYVIIAALAASSAFAAPAFAQDSASEAAFTGPRIAVIGGYDKLKSGSGEDSDIDSDDQSLDSFTYGVEAGYDIAFDSVVVGAEAEISDSTGKVDFNNPDPNYFGYGRVKTGRDIYVGGRLGILATPKTLVYAKVGYTNARLDATASDGTTEIGRNFKLDGYRVGAGVEQAVTDKVFAKVEYRYSNYGDAKYEFDNGGTISNFDVDTDRHQVVAGVGIRF